MSTYSLTLRQEKGSVLTIEELDNNFQYLQTLIPQNPTGSYLPLSGGTMDTGAYIYFGTGGQNISQGSFDNSTGGNNGISLNCAVGYELNWQGGHLSNRTGGSYQNLIFDSPLQVGIGTLVYPYEIQIGDIGSPNVLLGVDGGAYFQFKDGNQASGKVLTSDANGNATWQNISTPQSVMAALPSFVDDGDAGLGGLSIGDSYFSTSLRAYTRRLT